MIPINDYQASIYNQLSNGMGINVYDEPPVEVVPPLLIIGDYTMTEGNIKNFESYTFSQKFDIYSSYEGKKEVNDLTSKLIKNVSEKANTSINKNWNINVVSLFDCLVFRDEQGFYVANITLNITIERC